MDENLQRPLDDTELDELHTLLAERGGDDALLLDGVHGLVTAIAAGPEAIEVDEWLPHVLDPEQPFETVDAAERAFGLVLRLYNATVSDLDRFTWEPILGETRHDDEVTVSAAGWCEGFSLGVDLRAELWETRMAADPRLMDALEPILELAGDAGLLEHPDGETPEPLDESEYDTLIARLPKAAQDVQQYWRDHPPGSDIPPAVSPAARPVPRRRGGRSVH